MSPFELSIDDSKGLIACGIFWVKHEKTALEN